MAARGREEPVADAAGAPGRHLGVPADVHRDGARDRAGPADAVGERGELTLVGGLVLAPQRPHGGDPVVGASAALGEGDADGVELLLQPAHPHTQLHPAARQVVEGGDLLGQDHRVALGLDQDPGGQVDGGRGRGQVGQPHQRVRDRRVVGAGHPARRGRRDTSTRTPRAPPCARRSTATRTPPPRRPGPWRGRRRGRRTGRCWRRRCRTSCGDLLGRQGADRADPGVDAAGQIGAEDVDDGVGARRRARG